MSNLFSGIGNVLVLIALAAIAYYSVINSNNLSEQLSGYLR